MPRSPVRQIHLSADFRGWAAGLDPERQARVTATLRHIAVAGPTLGRPRVDSLRGTRLHKLKEARVGRSTRILFAFDSNQDLVALAGGDKAGRWNRWYPAKIQQAERRYQDHERRLGKEAPWRDGRARGRRPPEMGR